MNGAFLERVKGTRSSGMITMDAPELGTKEDPFTLYLMPPALRDSDYSSQAVGEFERVIRLFIRIARDADGKRLVEDADLRELMREGGAPVMYPVALRALKLVAVPKFGDTVKN
ncbi:hypothetical protein SAMN06273572_10250 [Monaibacterium marinum]|uniref:Uncharacterized protein n=1 Tax=Pontivivens marinum TaxID=1690039 RepID=A0A2C9CPV9_9RHOB|nr:hypothetical protein [Monaibacterium marinum]SOH93374.1 hypothetical protein SAMN06273572_10250 [Monaibacterium marinum]